MVNTNRKTAAYFSYYEIVQKPELQFSNDGGVDDSIFVIDNKLAKEILAWLIPTFRKIQEKNAA